MEVDKLRASTEFVKNTLKGELICVEIGVKSGTNSRSILENLHVNHLYLIDPLVPYQGRGEGYISIAKKALEETVLIPYKDKVTWIKKISDDSVDEVPNEVDFIYIDGDHSYGIVKSDIKNYYPKVRSGGILAGHDYDSSLYWGVKVAVDEFAKEYNLKLYTKYSAFPTIKKGATDWWIVKP